MIRLRTLAPVLAARRFALALALASALAPATLSAQRLEGRVVDARTGQGVGDARVTAVDASGRRAARVRTAADGTFALALPRTGEYRLGTERIGYESTSSAAVPVGLRETVEVTVRLSTEALAIEPLTVTGRREPRKVPSLERNGFYEREQMGLGRRIVREDFEGKFQRDVSTIILRQPGISALQGRGKQKVYFARATQAHHAFLEGSNGICFPAVYLDGVRVNTSNDLVLDDVISPDQVEAIELLYGPAQIPMRFRDDESSCGVILVWTRAGDAAR